MRSRFDGRWCAGFEVADGPEDDQDEADYRLRRRSDGAILPALFPAADLVVDRPDA